MDFSFLEKILLNYLESHPDVVEKLIAALVDALVKKLEGAKSNG